MSIFDNDDIITPKYLKDRGFTVFNNYAILWLELSGRYLSHKIEYSFKDKKVVLWGGYDERCTNDISTISDLEFEILACIEYLKNKHQTTACIYKCNGGIYEDTATIPYLKSLGFINGHHSDTEYIKGIYRGGYYIFVRYDVQFKNLEVVIYDHSVDYRCNFDIKSISDFRYIYDIIHNDLKTLISYAEGEIYING